MHKFRNHMLLVLPICLVLSGCFDHSNQEPNRSTGCSVSQVQIPGADNVYSPNTTAYMQKRHEFIEKNRELNFSSALALNEAEKKLDAHIKQIISAFREKYLESNLFCPTQNYLTIKECVQTSPLLEIIKQMPKGGVLHIHTGSTGDAEWLVKRAMADENTYIYLPSVVMDGDKLLKGTMNVFAKGSVPQGYQSMRILAENDKDFVGKVVHTITMTKEDALLDRPWNKFDDCFDRVRGLLHDESIFRDFYKNAFEALAKDNIQFVELRASLKPLHDISGKVYSDGEVIKIYRSIINDIRQRYPNFSLKIIISNNRSKDNIEQRKLLEKAYRLRAEHPDMIVGYDLVGDETIGNTTLYYLDNLLTSAQEFASKYKTDLPYYFHDGESDWENDYNLFDAVLLHSKRIGHGFNLFYFPWLIDVIKNEKICMEICPISNQVLGYVRDLRLHPAAGYIKQGVPCVLSPDDPMMFTTVGVSPDFWEAIMAWNLDLQDIKQFCLNSIIYSAYNADEKKKALEVWQHDWDAFVEQQVAEIL